MNLRYFLQSQKKIPRLDPAFGVLCRLPEGSAADMMVSEKGRTVQRPVQMKKAEKT